MFDNIIVSLLGLIVEFKEFIVVAAAFGILTTAICMAIGGSLREKAKENIIYIILAIIMAAGCIQYATDFWDKVNL